MLKTIRQFVTDNAQRLTQQLSQFEQNVATELLALEDGKLATPTQVLFAPGSPATRSLTTGQVALCDTVTAPVSVPLATPADGKPGFAWIVRRSGSNTVTLLPGGMVGGVARTINNAASRVFGLGIVGGPFAVYFDGANWWSV